MASIDDRDDAEQDGAVDGSPGVRVDDVKDGTVDDTQAGTAADVEVCAVGMESIDG
jgi:hypothetical protein